MRIKNPKSMARDAVIQRVGPMIRSMNNYFSKNKNQLGKAGELLKVKGPTTLQSILRVAKENPITTLYVLYSSAEFSGLVDEIFESNPHIKAQYESAQPADTVASLKSPVPVSEKALAGVEMVENINSLTLAEIEGFKDESATIDRVLASMPGRTESERRLQFNELRRIINADDSTFAIYDRLNELKGR